MTWIRPRSNPTAVLFDFDGIGSTDGASLRARTEPLTPEDHLRLDSRTVALIRAIARRASVAVVSGDPSAIAGRTLDALGLGGVFSVVVGSDSGTRCGPRRERLQTALEVLGASADATVMIGERYGDDIAAVIVRGGGGLLIHSRQDWHDACARVGTWLDA